MFSPREGEAVCKFASVWCLSGDHFPKFALRVRYSNVVEDGKNGKRAYRETQKVVEFGAEEGSRS
jgi:hypothetical protein